MPYAFNGYCFDNTDKALQAFQQEFPKIGDINITSHVSSSITGGGNISYSLLTRPIASNTVSIRTGTLQLSTCTESMGVAPSPFVFSQSDAASVGIAIATLWLSVGVLKFLWDRHFH